MRWLDLAMALGAFSFAFLACSSTEHQLGESAGGTSGASGTESSGAEGGTGDSGLAGGSSGGSGASGSGTGGASGSGGAGGNANAAGDDMGGAAPVAGRSNDAGASGQGGGGPELGCVESGGTVTTQLCCSQVEAFPPLCGVGACTCSPTSSREVTVCKCPQGTCFNGQACVAQ